MASRITTGRKANDAVMFVLWSVFLVIILVTIAYFTAGAVKRELDIRDAEARVFANRIIYSQNGLSYYDIDLGKTIPGSVDIIKINATVLESLAELGENKVIAAMVTLMQTDGTVIRQAPYNSLWYYRWQPLLGKGGSGGAGEIIEKRYVNVYENGKFREAGILEIQVIIPNS